MSFLSLIVKEGKGRKILYHQSQRAGSLFHSIFLSEFSDFSRFKKTNENTYSFVCLY